MVVVSGGYVYRDGRTARVKQTDAGEWLVHRYTAGGQVYDTQVFADEATARHWIGPFMGYTEETE